MGSIWALPQAAVADEAAPTGQISGTVTGDRIFTGEGIANAWRLTGDGFYYSYSARIAPDGTYIIDELPAGEYRVGFNELGYDDGDGITSWIEWWDDAVSLEFSAPVQVDTAPVAGVDANVDTLAGAVSDPVISGTAAFGKNLSVSRGVWPAGVDLGYAWYAGDTLLQDGASSSITLGADAVGKRVSVDVYAALDAAGFPSDEALQFKRTAETAVVKAATLKVGTPSVSGTAKVAGTVSAKPGAWTKGTKLSYQWFASGKAIKGATKASYKLPASLAGKTLTVKVTGKKAGYVTATKTSKATLKVSLSATPTITGTAKVGQKLTAKPGRWTSGTRLSYQWYANGKAISKATGKTLTLSAGVKGKKITVKVTGKKAGYATVTTTSKATAAVKGKTVPSQVAKPISKTSCPKSHPIKGNQTTRHTSDWIYHAPGGQFYKATHPEQCFATADAARKAGYRASKR
ncbi:hypothetical protein [Microbacterium sp. MM2322]|uniref:sunset domain-containing protein n=1 Tax=Microbacterium sp. MM2322 TaxID=3157631 RepID=UPI0032D58B2D